MCRVQTSALFTVWSVDTSRGFHERRVQRVQCESELYGV